MTGLTKASLAIPAPCRHSRESGNPVVFVPAPAQTPAAGEDTLRAATARYALTPPRADLRSSSVKELPFPWLFIRFTTASQPSKG
jgi:hypothetical protein